MKIQTQKNPKRGFALVVTLSLMILLTVIAVGMLTLATVTLRTTGHENAMSVAKGNARLALMLALGELQKTTGPDRAITAPASIVDDKNPMGVTGVWRPWERGSSGESRNKGARNENFEQWLVSTVNGKPSTMVETPPIAEIGAKDSVTLLGNLGLGERSTEKNDDQRINLETTPLVTGKSTSRYAWAVIDEGTKARANLYETDMTSKAAAAMRVGAPPVDGVAALKGLDKLKPTDIEAQKMISMKTAGFILGDSSEKLKVYSPDLTVDSLSLMTDVVSGGLKKDFSLWFSKGLSSSEQSTKLYQDSGAVSASYPSDPPLSLLASYHDYYKKIGKREGSAVPAAGGVAARLPSSYVASDRAGNASPNVPKEPLMIPTVLRVDIIFSLVTRDVHGGRAQGLKDKGRPYMLHLLYLPVVTIHNPYNVPMTIEGMKVTFKNVPLAFQFLVDGQPVTNSMIPLNQMYTGAAASVSKDFSCTLSSAINSTRPMVLQAGQTKLFGTPKVAPTWRWQDESPGSGADGTNLFDWRNDKTANFQLAPTLMTPATIGGGFDCDWINNPNFSQTAIGTTCGNGEGILSLKGTETIGVKYQPYAPPAANGNFNVKIELKQSGRFLEAGAFTIRYGDERSLKSIVEQGTSLRFPTARSFPETYPNSRVDPRVKVNDLYEKNTEMLKNYTNPKPFVIFSVGSRTTKESFIPTRTIADANPVMNIANIDLTRGKDPIGGVPLEMVMMPIRGGNAAIEGDRNTEEGYAFGGSGDLNGSPQATFYELPKSPLQSLAQFRNANLAGSGFMPMVTYTAGESRAHPQIGTNTIQSNWTNRSEMLDHTWLSNEALWDRYFLSTIADQTTEQFDTDKPYTEVMRDFFTLADRLPNQRFQPYGGDGTGTPAVLQGNGAQEDIIAASLMLRGGFNVNSTSEDAWVAVLSGLRGKSIETLSGIETVNDSNTAFPRERVPTGKNIDDQIINDKVTMWQGFRSLSDQTIAALAKEITTEVRKRGPFLSLADFVNRGIGSESDETNVKGAIQAAIDHLGAINQVADGVGIELTAAQVAANGYKSTQAGIGNSATDSPASLTQGDILTGLGSRITVRSDTFRIRGYGESRDASGKVVLARAWCEAIVQRVPDFVDPADDAIVRQPPVTGSGDGGSVNQIFGRAYEIVSFRWLSPSEV